VPVKAPAFSVCAEAEPGGRHTRSPGREPWVGADHESINPVRGAGRSPLAGRGRFGCRADPGL